MKRATATSPTDIKPVRGRAPSWRAKTALLIMTLLLLVAALEIGTRLFTDVTPPLTMPDAMVGKRYVQNYQGRVYSDEAKRYVELRFNGEGFRGPDYSLEKPLGVKRVAVLGDSMVAALGVDEQRTMVAQLEQMLNESHGDETWEVMNFGVSGASPGQALALYRNVVKQYQPDIVLCAFFVGNDLSDSSRQLSTNPRIYFDLDEEGRLYQRPFSAARANLTLLLNRHSRFYVWQKHATNKARHNIVLWLSGSSDEREDAPNEPGAAVTAHVANQPVPAAEASIEPVMHEAAPLATEQATTPNAGENLPLTRPAWSQTGELVYYQDEDADISHAWRIVEGVFRQFAVEVREQPARFAVVLLPVSRQIYDDQWRELMTWTWIAPHAAQFDQRHPDRRLASICRDLGVPLVTMTDAFRAASGSDDWLFLADGVGHFSERGNRLAAEQVYDFLVNGSTALAEGTFVGQRR